MLTRNAQSTAQFMQFMLIPKLAHVLLTTKCALVAACAPLHARGICRCAEQCPNGAIKFVDWEDIAQKVLDNGVVSTATLIPDATLVEGLS